MKQGLSRLVRRMFRRGQTGQTVVILAFGFIVLLGFVGIVTDVSLMFVRYSTLRRAIDAAAVSAAGQMRRALPTQAELTQSQAIGGTPTVIENRAIGWAYARNITSVNLAARQFIELYGLTPTSVLVDTCATTEILPRTDPPKYSDPQLECEVTTTPRKLVRVTAQVQSPTVFLRLLGWGTVTLEATAISETAVLDVVMIFDVSESMLNQTTYDDWDRVLQTDGTYHDESFRYYPARMTYPAGGGTGDATVTSYTDHPTNFADYYDAWTYLLTHTDDPNNPDPTKSIVSYSDSTALAAGQPDKIFQAIPFYVTCGKGDYETRCPGTAQSIANVAPKYPDVTQVHEPRKECRVRAFPGAGSFYIMSTGVDPFKPENDLRIELTMFMNQKRGYTGQYPKTFDGFAPAYNSFNCCNDPDGNWDFSDLVCQPMRQVRTATEAFLDRIDFSRGDRVGFVTFDRYAYLIDPDGPGNKSPMMDAEATALDMLHKTVGVRADPSYYADQVKNSPPKTAPGDGLWDSFVIGGGPWTPTNTDPNIKLITYSTGNAAPVQNGFNGTAIGLLNDYPVYNNCIFQNATLRYPLSLFSSPSNGDGKTDYSPPSPPNPPFPANDNSVPAYAATHPAYYKQRYPTPLSSPYNLPPVMNPKLPITPWFGQVPLELKDTMQLNSYELRAACRGSNVGAALRAANNALLDPKTIRTNGAVWVMVMLGDGAAAGSDPVRRNNLALKAPQVYNGTIKPTAAGDIAPIAGDYGVFGVCPYGSYVGLTFKQSPLLGDDFDRFFPYCSDKDPASRHFCFDPRNKDPIDKSYYIDLADSTDCTDTYDVDDFARDWADFIGLQDPFPALVSAEDLDRENLQLPTIFTIGFGLDFQQGDHSTVQVTRDANPEDYLGEELLRYIADVGDNNHMDTDYEQDLRGNNALDKLLAFNDDWGPRGPCEGPILNGFTSPPQIPGSEYKADLINPLPPKQNCGNYFNAPDAAELAVVFDTIASRMFTRLTR